MSGADETLAARLAALEKASGKKGAKPRPAPLAALLGTAAILMLGAVFWAISRPEPEPVLATAEAEEFQTIGSGFGAFDLQPAPTPLPEPEPLPAGPSATELELRETLVELQAELADLRARPVQAEDSAATAALADLSKQLASLEARSLETQSALEEQLSERDRELARIRMDLEIAQLNGAGPAAVDPQLAELERRREAERAAREARVNSKMLAWSGSGSGSTSLAGDTKQTAVRLSPDENFVRNGAKPAAMTQAEVIVNPGHSVLQGTMIQAVLETALDSSLPGVIRAVVSEDVHAFDGSRVLIPRGARLFGRYRSDMSLAQSRVTIAWDRIILPDNQSIRISAYGADELGRAGVTGAVDHRFGARFGSAALISLIGAIPAAAAAGVSDETGADLVEDVAGDLRDAGTTVMQDYLAIPPVIRMAQGARITVILDRDLEIY